MGILGALFGKKAKNTAKPFIRSTFEAPATAMAQQGQQAYNAQIGGLGLGDATAFNTGFDRFKQASGYQSALDGAARGVEAGAASRGLLGSGSTAMALQQSGADIANNTYNNYMDRLSKTGQQGTDNAINSAQLIAGVSDRPATSGIVGKIGQAAGGIASLFPPGEAAKSIAAMFGRKK